MSDTNLSNIENHNKDFNEQQKKILNRLQTIRVGKLKILKTLSALKQNEETGEVIERNLIEKLISSYDSLKEQEDEFILVFNHFISKNEKEPELDNENSNNVDTDENTELTLEERNEIKKSINEAQKIAGSAIVATDVNNYLNSSIRFTQEKIDNLKEVYNQKMKDRLTITNKALNDVESARLKLGQEQDSVDRKKKLIERLRKKVAVRLESAAIEKNSVNCLDDESELEDLLKEGERVPPVPVCELIEQKTEVDNSLKKEEIKVPNTKNEIHANISARFAAFEVRKQRLRELRSQLNRLEQRKMDKTFSNALSRLNNLTAMREQLENLSEDSVIKHKNEAEENNKKDLKQENNNIKTIISDENALNSSVSSSDKSNEDDYSISTEELITKVRNSFESTFHRYFKSFNQNNDNKCFNEYNNNSLPQTSLNENSNDNLFFNDLTLSNLKERKNEKIFDLVNNKKKTLSSENSECYQRICENSDTNKNLTSTFERKLNTIENIIQSHTNQLTWIGDQVVYLVESVDQFQQQFNDQRQKSQQQQCCSCSQFQQSNHNNQRRFSSNSAITVITNPLRSSNLTNFSLSPTNVSGSLLSLLQQPTTNYQLKSNNIQIFELMKNCLMSADKIALTKLLNVYFNYQVLKSPKQSIEEQVDLLVQKLLNGNTIYLSPPLSAKTPSKNGSFFTTSTLPNISHSPVNLTSKVLLNEFNEPSIIKNCGNKTSFTLNEESSNANNLLTNDNINNDKNKDKFKLVVEYFKQLTNNFNIKTVKQFEEINALNEQNCKSNFNFSGIEKHVCQIINTVLRSILTYSDIENDDVMFNDEFASKLRYVILLESQKVFILITDNQDALNLFLNQITILFDNILATELNEKKSILNLTINNESFIMNLFDIIFNELEFWKLMHNVDRLNVGNANTSAAK